MYPLYPIKFRYGPIIVSNADKNPTALALQTMYSALIKNIKNPILPNFHIFSHHTQYVPLQLHLLPIFIMSLPAIVFFACSSPFSCFFFMFTKKPNNTQETPQ